MIDTLNTALDFLPFDLSRNKLVHTIPAPEELTDRSSLKYFLDLYQKGYNGFSLIHTSQGREIPQTGPEIVLSGASFVYNQQLGKLDGLLNYVKPDWGQSKIKSVSEQTAVYRLRERVTGGTPAVDTTTDLTQRWLLKAGLADADFYAQRDRFFSTTQKATRRFLTWKPAVREVVSRTQEHYLSFLLNCSPLPSTINLRVTYGEVTRTALSISNVQLGQILICPASADVLNIPSDVCHYSVWLSDVNNLRLSEVRDFVIDRVLPKQERCLTFVNSLGGWDTLRATGTGEEKTKTKRVSLALDSIGDSTENITAKLAYVEKEKELVVWSGWLEYGSPQLVWLEELLTSEQIFLHTDKGHRFVELATSELVTNRDDERLIGRQFVFRYVAESPSFSNADYVNYTTTRPTGWKGIEYVHILDSFGKRTGYRKPMRLQKIYLDDMSVVRPLTYKYNSEGTEGYIGPLLDPTVTVGSTPYPSAAISRLGSYTRSTCGAGTTPGKATISIAAGAYGGEVAGEADLLAELAFTALDTQEYADANGPCDAAPWLYTYTVPAGYVHFRWNTLDAASAYSANFAVKEVDSVNKGNAWWASTYAPNDPDVYPAGTNDINIPVGTGNIWRLGFYKANGTTAKIYRNGTLLQEATFVDDYTEIQLAHAALASTDKVYILVV